MPKELFIKIRLIVFSFSAICFASVFAQEKEELIKNGEIIYAKNCSTCHGNKMKNPQWGFNLELFPVEQKIRFIDSVTYGKNAMPPWEDVLSANEIANIWSYFLSLR
jgi:mono/diheme cytochrome c family protein